MKDNIQPLVFFLVAFFGGIGLCMHDYPQLGGFICIVSVLAGLNTYDKK